MARGRVFGLKKSILLKCFFSLFCLGFFSYIFVCIFHFHMPELWFYGFCLFLGAFQILKSVLFKLDSSLYLGSLLCGIGTVGHVYTFTSTASYAAFYIALAFILASISAFVFCGQRFHLLLAFSIFFVSLYALLYVKNLINVYILIAFLVPFLLLLFLEIVFACFHKK